MVRITPLLLGLLLSRDNAAAFAPSSSSLWPHQCLSVPSFSSTRTTARLYAIAFGKPKNEDRFDRTASDKVQAAQPCILTVDGARYNMTAWAKAHPGGESILHKFHGKDASKAFHRVGHSHHAYDMLADFKIDEVGLTSTAVAAATAPVAPNKVPRWRQKLFTKEDPRGIHKSLGVFVLLHFAFRFSQMYFGDPSCGLGSRLGKGPSIIPALCLAPHALLSLSSLIFHTVPKERIVGKPMIWQEYRIHNIAFGVRSVVTAFLAWLSIYKAHAPVWRRTAVIGSCLTALTALMVADEGTRRLRVNSLESTTATMPYWEGCSVETQRLFKTFYAYCQFLATLACLHVGNPAYALSVLIPIQLASLLMTLVRKGLISAKSYHVGYTTTLIMPYFVAFRSMLYSPSLDMPLLFVLGWTLYQLRRRGINKYVLWVPVFLARATIGDSFLNWTVW